MYISTFDLDISMLENLTTKDLILTLDKLLDDNEYKNLNGTLKYVLIVMSKIPNDERLKEYFLYNRTKDLKELFTYLTSEIYFSTSNNLQEDRDEMLVNIKKLKYDLYIYSGFIKRLTTFLNYLEKELKENPIYNSATGSRIVERENIFR